MRARWFLFCFEILVGMEKCSILWKLVSFKYFSLFGYAYSRFGVGPRTDNNVLHKNCESMFYICVPNVFFCLYLRAQCFFLFIFACTMFFFVYICMHNVFFVYICVPNAFFFVYICVPSAFFVLRSNSAGRVLKLLRTAQF